MRTRVVATICACAGLSLLGFYGLRREASSVKDGAASPPSALVAEISRLKEERVALEQQIQGLRSANRCERPQIGGSGPIDSTTHLAGPREVSGVMRRAAEPPIEVQEFLVRRRNGQLFRELGLSDKQIDALMAVLETQAQRDPRQRMLGLSQTDPGPQTSAEREQTQRNQAEIAAVIGDSKAAQFEALQKTLPARAELRTLRDVFEQAGEPMTEAQQRALLAKVTEHGWESAPRTDGTLDDAIENARDFRHERAQRIRTAASTVLTPQQLKLMDQSEQLRTSFETSHPASRLIGIGAPQAAAGSGGT